MRLDGFDVRGPLLTAAFALLPLWWHLTLADVQIAALGPMFGAVALFPADVLLALLVVLGSRDTLRQRWNVAAQPRVHQLACASAGVPGVGRGGAAVAAAAPAQAALERGQVRTGVGQRLRDAARRVPRPVGHARICLALRWSRCRSPRC